MKFTDKGVAALKPKAERYEIWEGGTGLGIRILPSGHKSWVFMYRIDGKARRVTLGKYPNLTLAKARVKHAQGHEMLEPKYPK